MEQVPISYLSTGKDLLRYTTPYDGRPSKPVVIANPDYGEESLPPLSGTQREANILSQLYPNIAIYTEKEATTDVVRSLHNPEFLHIGTHGFVTPNNLATDLDDNPMTRSGLVFAKSAQSNNRLFASETMMLTLNETKLVVLSACNTGVGQITNGEGVYGMIRALHLAGARSQVVTLWEVDDATVYFMEHFYTNWKMVHLLQQ